jgi:hypothetical protein
MKKKQIIEKAEAKTKKEKPLKTWRDVDSYMKSLGYTRYLPLKQK